MTDLAAIDVAGRRDGFVVAQVRGELDLSNLHAVHTALVEATARDARGLVLDLSGLGFLDSSGVETLLRLRRALEDRRQDLAVAIPEGAPARRALEVTGADADLVLRATPDEALAAVRDAAAG